MRRKKLWNRTLAAVLGLALMVGAPLVNLGNGQLLGGVTITVQAGHSTKNTGGTIIGQHWILTLSGTVTAEEIRTAINNWGFGSTNVRDYNIKEIVCEPGTVIVGDLIYGGKGMFEGFSGLTTADFSNATFTDTGDSSQLFKGCSSLTTINWGEFDLDGVTKADEMFSGCTSIKTLDLSAWDTGDLTSTKSMFYGCSSLTTIYASETWRTASINSDTNMFYGCTNLKGGNGTKQSNSNVGKSYACFDLEGMPGYLTYRGDLEMQPEDAAGLTESGTEAYWADPDDDAVK